MKNFLQRLHNILIWLPILWRDRDWDFGFLLRILQFKISRMRQYQQKYGLSTYQRQELIAHKMRTCELLIERLLSEDYIKDWAQPDWRTWPRELTEQEERDMRAALDHGNKMRRQDEDLLFTILRKHYRNWWD